MPAYRESFIFHIATDPVAMFWTGLGNLPVSPDAVITEEAAAWGGGELISIPDFEQLINGLAQRLEFTLSGVSKRTIAFAQAEASQVAGARVDIGRITFGPDWQQVGPIEWEWTGEARSLSVGSQDTPNGRSRSITLTVAAGDTTRSRAPLSFFTDSDQRRRSSDDAVFSHVAAINSGTSRRWGPAA